MNNIKIDELKDRIKKLEAALTEILDLSGSDGPEYHDQAMGCGLEDRDITDRYEAMYHGWDRGVFRSAEHWAWPVYEIAKAALEI